VSAQHTPGPWVADGPVVEDFNAPMRPDIAVCATGMIVSLPPDGDEARANACLIASAPDLLAALEAVVSRLNRLGDADYLYRARAAIARAKGEVTA